MGENITLEAMAKKKKWIDDLKFLNNYKSLVVWVSLKAGPLFLSTTVQTKAQISKPELEVVITRRRYWQIFWPTGPETSSR